MQNNYIQFSDYLFNPWEEFWHLDVPAEATWFEDNHSEGLPLHLDWDKKKPRQIVHAAYWRQPRQWNAKAARLNTRHRVYCPFGDLMDDEASTVLRARLFWLISQTPHLDWLISTYQPENFRHCLRWMQLCSAPYPNVWLGINVQSRNEAKLRIPILQQTPAKHRFISVDYLTESLGELDLSGISLVICGSDSRSEPTPMNLRWAIDLRDQCRRQNVEFFMK